MVPSERAEQIAFRQWLDLKGIAYFRVPNETWTPSYKQRAINYSLGVKAGIPDMFICLPNRLLAIEMKKTKGGVVSKHQKHWLDVLAASGVRTFVAYGAEQAIGFVQSQFLTSKHLPSIVENDKKEVPTSAKALTTD